MIKFKRAKSTTTIGHYVKNADLLPAVLEAKALGKVTDKLIRMISMIAERYSSKGNFAGYSFRDEMVDSAIVNLCNNALKFDPNESSNPFSFYTTAIHRSFLQYMADEKKQRKIRDSLLVNAGANPSLNYLMENEDDVMIPISDDMDITDEDHHVHDELKPADPEEKKPARSKHPKWAAREPGPILTYKPEDIVYDPITKTSTIKPGAIPEKKAYKPRANIPFRRGMIPGKKKADSKKGNN